MPEVEQDATGAALIAAERQRQIDSEGYGAEHDSEHGPEVLLRAATCYLHKVPDVEPRPPHGWPWAAENWKPGSRSRNLVKAGALIAAALDAMSTAEIDTLPCPDCTATSRCDAHWCCAACDLTSRPEQPGAPA